MNILDSIYNAQPIKPTGQQWMTRETTQEQKEAWTKPTAPPADDPFAAPKPQQLPWRGVELPKPVALQPGAWLTGLYDELQQRMLKGYEYIDQADLTPEKQQQYERRIVQLGWQLRLIEMALLELTDPQAAYTAKLTVWPTNHREYHAYCLREAHAVGQVAVPITTPGGRRYRLVPWRADPPVPGELDPQDMAALARTAALIGVDELTLLDRIAAPEVTP